ncbi:LytR/AlgR family response regulator transcription factor [Larkinella soli]|uniref:LytR/AlgR family response regulator transcription factor n=1 Tax=Larkinella soli TaxID=1770527 RepID=UPI000FFC1A45|nr:LytTR family DNA-binding domain-containing protein [Larkinella soli]
MLTLKTTNFPAKIVSNTPTAVLQVYARGNRQRLFDTSELVYLQGDANYTWLHWKDRPSMLVSKTLKYFMSMLPAGDFVRLHRNCIVNCRYVERLEQLKNGGGLVYLETGTTLTISRRRWEEIERHFTLETR